ncbi:MAG: hypothetical protein JSW00_17500 [Thermoplasmata archaeon]|nr:MAG: hypothetical protein JSW00_17500 [Thermoplasmata archaeon]
MRRAGSILVFAMIFLSLLSLFSISSKAGVFTEVTVEVPPACEVDVSPGSSGIATLQGTVTCQTLNTLTPVSVTLEATSTIGWVTISPGGVIFQGSHQSEDINITIGVPITTSTTGDYTCTISGTWEQGPTTGPVNEDSFQILIKSYYMMTIYSETPLKEVKQGESTDFNLTVENTGNCDDDYQVEVHNVEELESSNLLIPKLPKLTVEEGCLRNIQLPVDASSDTPTGEYQINVRVTSCKSEGSEDGIVFEEYPLVLKVKKGGEVKDEISSKIGETLFDPMILIPIIVIVIVVIVVAVLRRSAKSQGVPS